jgi:pimeloyl-ACP methyl ester carboxylesterase
MAIAPEPPITEPRWWGNHLAELRWQLEMYRLMADPVFRGAGVPHGDGRPVLLLPGFLAGDLSLKVLGGWLGRIGYAPHYAGFVANVDCSNRAMESVDRHVRRMERRSGRRVAVIGHSRGGHYARAIGARRPDRVSHVISLGAGLQRMFTISAPTQSAVDLVRRGQRLLGRSEAPGCLTDHCSCAFFADYTAPFPTDRVRMVSVHSRGDGVVRWQGCIVDYARNVEVTGSHVGLAFNRKAYRVIAEALAEPERGAGDADARPDDAAAA